MTHHDSLRIEKISTDQHYQFMYQQESASFLQAPDWSRTKLDWKAQSLGWWDGENLVAVAMVLFRPIPVPLLKNRSLAYIASGPIFDPVSVDLEDLLEPLVPFLKSQGAFLVRVGLPLDIKRWAADDVRNALSKSTHATLTDLEPIDVNQAAEQLRSTMLQLGWHPPEVTDAFAAGQPLFQARVPLPVIDPQHRADREDPIFVEAVESVLKRMNSTSRNETRKSTRSELKVWEGTDADVQIWQKLYEETAERENFRPRPAEYFTTMYQALNAKPGTQCRFLFAQHEDHVLAAAIFVQQADTSWYLYGGSTRKESKRHAPRALQLEQIKLSLESGSRWLDHGGVSPTLDKNHPLAGLTRFKTQMGADIIQTMGEWDFPINKLLTRGFNLYMNRRG